MFLRKYIVNQIISNRKRKCMEFIPACAETETLHRLHSMIRYSQWIYDVIRPFIKGKILEIGCGIGAMTRHIIKDYSSIVSIDVNKSHIQKMYTQFCKYPELQIYYLDILQDPSNILKKEMFDTILLINVLEHIEREDETLQKIYELLAPEGNSIMLVPAYQNLFGSLDEIVGHLRRYNKKLFIEKLHTFHLESFYTTYMNTLGMFGWWLNSKFLKKREFSISQIAFFEYLIPFISRIEKWIHPPFGQSILIISRKK